MQSVVVKLFCNPTPKTRMLNPPQAEINPFTEKLPTTTFDEQIQYLYHSKKRKNDNETMDNSTQSSI